jgi:hypothetical protein
VVVHVCNPAAQKVDIGGLLFEASLGKKFLSPISKNKLDIVATREAEVEGLWSKAIEA